MKSNNEERLIEALSRALDATDPIPDHVVEAAREAIFWRTIDAELAELVFDSSTELLTSVRGADLVRQVTFRSPGVEIEIMVTDEGNCRLVGQLVPPQVAQVELRSGNQVLTTSTDSLGRFTFADVQRGSVQLAVRLQAGALVVTDWLVI